MTTRTLDMANVIASDVTIAGDKTLSGDITFSGDVVPSTPLSHRNLIINGAMQVAQRGTSATVANISNEGYSTLDRWYLNFNASLGGSATFSQDSDAPTGFSNSLKIQCASSATASGTQFLSLQYKIEAQDLQQLGYGSSGAKTATLSFYAKRAGTDWGKLSVQFYKPDNTVEYTLPTATTLTTSWARYTIPVPANTATAIDDDNGLGLRIGFVLAGNSSGTYASTADTSWGSTRKDYTSDVGNLLSDTSNIFYLAGVQLELGDKATPFEHRSYGDELARCQRYYQKVIREGNGTGFASGFTSTANFFGVGKLTTTMRTTPSVGYFGTLSNISYTHPNVSAPVSSINYIGCDGENYHIKLASGTTTTNGYGAYARIAHGTAGDTGLTFEAELL